MKTTTSLHVCTKCGRDSKPTPRRAKDQECGVCDERGDLFEVPIAKRRSTAFVSARRGAWKSVKYARFHLESKETKKRFIVEGKAAHVRQALEWDASASVIIEFTEIGTFGKRTVRFV